VTGSKSSPTSCLGRFAPGQERWLTRAPTLFAFGTLVTHGMANSAPSAWCGPRCYRCRWAGELLFRHWHVAWRNPPVRAGRLDSHLGSRVRLVAAWLVLANAGPTCRVRRVPRLPRAGSVP